MVNYINAFENKRFQGEYSVQSMKTEFGDYISYGENHKLYEYKSQPYLNLSIHKGFSVQATWLEWRSKDYLTGVLESKMEGWKPIGQTTEEVARGGCWGYKKSFGIHS